MYYVGRDELAHARWKSRGRLAVVSLLFGVGETNCSQGIVQSLSYIWKIIEKPTVASYVSYPLDFIQFELCSLRMLF